MSEKSTPIVATPAGDEIEPSLDDLNDQFPEDDEEDDAPKVDVSQLANAIVGAVNAAQGPRKIKSGEYQRTRSEHRDKPQLTQKVHQNGIMLSRRQMTADAINFTNALRPGVYQDGFISVVQLRDGTNGTSLDIRYANKTFDERMNFKSKWPTFEHMLAAVLREQSANA